MAMSVITSDKSELRKEEVEVEVEEVKEKKGGRIFLLKSVYHYPDAIGYL